MGYIMFKDIYNSRKSILIYMVLAIFFIMSGFGGESSNFVGIIIMMMSYGVSIRIQYDEERHMGYSFLRTLPIKGYKIVVSKFLTSFILAIFTVIYILGLLVVLPKGEINADSIVTIVATLSVALILTGIFHLLVYRYGSSKAITYTRIFFFSFFLIPFIGKYFADFLKKFISKEEAINIVSKLNSIFTNLGTVGWVALILVTGIFIYLLLMLRSIAIFKRKVSV